MGEIELRLEQQSRATQDAKAEGGGTPPWMEKVENVGNIFSRERPEHVLEVVNVGTNIGHIRVKKLPLLLSPLAYVL